MSLLLVKHLQSQYDLGKSQGFFVFILANGSWSKFVSETDFWSYYGLFIEEKNIIQPTLTLLEAKTQSK